MNSGPGSHARAIGFSFFSDRSGWVAVLLPLDTEDSRREVSASGAEPGKQRSASVAAVLGLSVLR